MSTIRMQDPLKQGLKPKTSHSSSCIKCIRMQDPLKQGLKPIQHSSMQMVTIDIRMQDPLKQGLKLSEIRSHAGRGTPFECKIH